MSINTNTSGKQSASLAADVLSGDMILPPALSTSKAPQPVAIFSAPTTPATHPHVESGGHGHSHGAGEHSHSHGDGGHSHSHGGGEDDHSGDEHDHSAHGHSHSHNGDAASKKRAAPTASAAADALKAALDAADAKAGGGGSGSGGAAGGAANSSTKPSGPVRTGSDSKLTVKTGRHKTNQHSAAIDIKSPAACRGVQGRAGEDKVRAANAAARKKLSYAACFCCIFMVCEVVGGIYANSLAVLTDAAHLLSDLAGFLISIFALWLASIEPTSTLSFGFHRAEILGALLSVLLIWLMTGILVYEAVFRVRNPEDVDGKLMFIVAGAGLVVNVIMGLILASSGHGHSHGLGGGHGHSHGGETETKKPKAKSLGAAAAAATSYGTDGNTKPLAHDTAASNGGHSHDHNAHGHSHDASPRVTDKLIAGGGGAGKAAAHSDDDHGHSHAGGDHSHSHGPSTANGGSKTDDHDHEHKEEENINVKAALIHVFGDALQSVGVMIAAGLIWYDPEWKIADPVCTFFFSVLVLFTTIRLVRQSVGVLMEGVPEGIDPEEVQSELQDITNVLEVHDLHIWSLSVGKPSLSCHLLVDHNAQGVLEAVHKLCATRFNIHHTTVQIETAADRVACNPNYRPLHPDDGHGHSH